MRYTHLISICCRYTGFTRLLEALPKKPLLLALNYHRIGNPAQTPYDSGVFSATVEELDGQVRFLKRRFHVATLDEALHMIETGQLHRPTALLTFDDGYRDNYEAAFPVLAAHGVQGVFFLPTSFIGTNHVAFWDVVAYIVKRSRRQKFRLASEPGREFDIAADGPARVIQQVLRLCKGDDGADPEHLIGMLEEACDSARPNGSERLFINWQEAEAMLARGMAIESHSHTHPALSRLSRTELLQELILSKRLLEERLGIRPRCLAYPFGLPESISPLVIRAVEKTGYRAAFSFYGGLNTPGAMERFNIRREAVTAGEGGSFELRAALTALTARPELMRIPA